MPSYPGPIQLPFARIHRYRTAFNETECGRRFSFYFWATPLRSWEITYSAITAAEADTLRTFFAARKGKWEYFEFTDPGNPPDIPAVVYPRCRFDQDELPIQHVGPNQCALNVRIVQLP